jgi:metal-sulfur cluster biosynthetic enzyme
MIDREAVRAALGRVPEPCSIAMRAPTDICEMGLVEDIRIEHGTVRVELVLTDPSCAHFGSMRRYIEDALAELDGVEAVEVVMSTTKLWTADRRVSA